MSVITQDSDGQTFREFLGTFGWFDDTSNGETTFSYNTTWTEVAPDVWVSDRDVLVQAPEDAGNQIGCRVRANTDSAVRLTFGHDHRNGNSHNETDQRDNQLNWNGSGKNRLGPSTTRSQSAYALYSTLSPVRELEYAIPFAPDCSITGPTDIFLRVYDADNPTNEQVTPPAGFPDPVQSSAYGQPGFQIWADHPSGTSNRVRIFDGQSGANLGFSEPARIGNDEYKDYRITVEPGVRYTWHWYNIQSNNGVQIWMPFSELYADSRTECFEFDGAVEACTVGNTVQGWVADRNNPGRNDFDVRVYTRLATETSAVTTWDETANGATPLSPGVAGNHGFSVNIPASDLSSTVQTVFTVEVWDDSRTTMLYSPDPGPPDFRTITVGPCIAPPADWDYDPTVDGSGSATVTDARAGETFTIDSEVHSNEVADGGVYTHTIRVQAGGTPTYRSRAARNIDVTGGSAGGANNNGSVKQRQWTNRPSITSGDNDDRNATYTVRSSPYHNEQICFEGVASPAAGGSRSDSVDYSGDAASDPGGFPGHTEDRVYTECITTYNERFAFTTPTVEPSLPVAIPGQQIEFTVTVRNNGTAPGNASEGQTGRSVPISMTSTRGGSIARSGNFTVPVNTAHGTGLATNLANRTIVDVDPALQAGDDVCINVNVPVVSGYSDGDRSVDGEVPPINYEYCVVVAEQPYFTVAGHDTWAGAVWDAGNACSDPAQQNTDGQIRSVLTTVLGTFGSHGEYAAYAIEAISGFGTGGAAGLDRLTFANDLRPTEYGEVFGPGASAASPPRCLEDYHGLLYDASQVASSLPLSTLGSAVDDTLYFSTTQTISNDVTIRARKTVVIDGDLIIRGDIDYGNFAYNSGTGEISGPSLALIVRGNIYIDESVNEITGLVVAQPRADGTGGVVDTCRNNGALIEFLSTTVCDEQLTFSGSVVAQYIHMRRTWGGVLRSQAGTQVGGAEQFNFNPALYQNQPLVEPVGGVSGSEFPVLQIKDLPPVF